MSATGLFRGYTGAWTDGEWITVGAWAARVEMVRPPKRIRVDFDAWRVEHFHERWAETTSFTWRMRDGRWALEPYSTVVEPPHRLAYGHSVAHPGDAIVRVAGVHFNARWWDAFNAMSGREPDIYLSGRLAAYAEWPDARLCSIVNVPGGWKFGDPR